MNDEFSKVIVTTSDPLNRFYVGWTGEEILRDYYERELSTNLTINDAFIAENQKDLALVVSEYISLPASLVQKDADIKYRLTRLKEKIERPVLPETLISLDKIISVTEFDM